MTEQLTYKRDYLEGPSTCVLSNPKLVKPLLQ
jgi:hypothetical protein